jgi:hypothetical protein
MGGGGKGGSDEAKRARREEEERQQRIRQGTARVGQIFGSNFNDEFFGKQRDNYLNYATPQLNQQHEDAGRELTFALDRSGNLDSSSRADLSAELQRRYGIERQAIADKGLEYQNNSRNSVEDARANLISMLNVTGDAEGAANDAIRRASALSQPAAYSPLSNLFLDFTNSLGAPFAAQRAQEMSAGSYGQRGTGLYGAPSGSVVTR